MSGALLRALYELSHCISQQFDNVNFLFFILMKKLTPAVKPLARIRELRLSEVACPSSK